MKPEFKTDLDAQNEPATPEQLAKIEELTGKKMDEVNAKIRALGDQNISKTDVFKLVYCPHEKVITCNNKDFSVAKTFAATRDALRQFGGRTKMFVKAKIITNNKGDILEFRIVKDVPNKHW